MFLKNNCFSSVLLAALLSVTTGCLTAKKVDKWIDKHYDGNVTDKGKGSDYITFRVGDSLGNRLSSTDRAGAHMLPLLFYWEWHYALASQITVRAPFNSFTSSFVSYANSKGLKDKLNGRSLELTVHANPANFSIHDKGNLVFLLLFYVSSETIYITPESGRFKVSYRVLENGQEVKSGVVSVANTNKEVVQKILQSTRKMVGKYLDVCDENMQKMSRQLVDELMYELP